MALVDDTDIQVHLPVDKFNISASDFPDDLTKVKLDIERVVKGRLSGVYSPTTLAGWSSHNNTPSYIRALSGRLAAALLYRLRLAEDYPEDADYAKAKYREGMQMLELVADGIVVLPEVDEEVDTGRRLSTNHFVALPDPKFAMDSEF